MPNAEAEKAKADGNAALAAQKFDDAVAHYTRAIGLDDSNHIYFSNRAAALQALGKFDEALADSVRVTEMKPDWWKGWQRRGAALQSLHRLDEAEKAFNEGLKLEPQNESLLEGMGQIQSERARVSNPLGKLFSDPVNLAKLAAHPKTRGFASDPQFQAMLKIAATNPQMLQMFGNDSRFQTALSVILGADFAGDADDESGAADAFAPAAQQSAQQHSQPQQQQQPPPASRPQAAAPKPAPAAPVLSETEQKVAAAKDAGIAAYREHKFDEALQHYAAALEIDPNEMTVVLNMAAVYFERDQFDECIQACQKALDVAIDFKTDSKRKGQLKARAYTRMANAYAKLEKLDEAIQMLNKSLTENRDGATLTRKLELERLKKQRDIDAYINPELGEKEKAAGNECFKQAKYPEAIRHYEEAMKRNPQDFVLWSNRAASLMKLGAYPDAVKDCDTCLSMNPTFLKAITRKAACQFFMKEYHKCLDTYQKGLEIDSNNEECQEGLRRTMAAIQSASGEPDEERVRHAMADPEIQSILSDPSMRQVLNDLQTDPRAAQSHLSNPVVRAKLFKLQAAGVLQMR